MASTNQVHTGISARVKPLDAAQIHQAYPLIRLAFPQARQEQWQTYAARLLTPNAMPGLSGVMSIQSSRGYIHALFCYSVDDDLCGRMLAVSHLVVLSLAENAALLRWLLEEMEVLAAKLGCCGVSVGLSSYATNLDSDALVTAFGACGHAFDGFHFSKAITPRV